MRRRQVWHEITNTQQRLADQHEAAQYSVFVDALRVKSGEAPTRKRGRPKGSKNRMSNTGK